MDYFKKLAEESDIPYQTLINLYLRDCAASKKRLKLAWKPDAARVQTDELRSLLFYLWRPCLRVRERAPRLSGATLGVQCVKAQQR